MSDLAARMLAFLRRWWRPIQIVLGVAIVIAAIVKVRQALTTPEAAQVVWVFDLRWIAASLLVTWAMYALLITGWRLVLIGWGERLGWRDAARIWTISSLGSLLPGRVWAIAGMAIMAERAGVAAAAATGSAIVMQLLSMATGAIVGLVLVGPLLIAKISGGMALLVLLTAGALLGSAALTSATVMAWVTRMLRREVPLRALAPGALVAGILLNAAAWGGYGLALVWIARGTIPSLALTWPVATGAYALAYLVGYVIFFFAPAGLGGRESTLVLLLAPQLGFIPAGALAIASRLASLVNQFGAAAPFLLSRSTPRDHT